MNLNLVGKRAIVCGSTQGIGKAIAVELANLGAHVTLLARNEEKLRQVLSQLPQGGQQMHEYLVADFSNVENLKKKIEEYASKKEIHILINNTGGPTPGTALEAGHEELTLAFEMHLLCNHALVQTLVPKMKASNYGRIINIISTSVKEPIPGLGVSNTIRAAVANWAKTLSVELAPFGITVNNVLPGYTDTQRLRSMIDGRSERSGKEKAAVEEEMKALIPVGRFASPKEVAAAAAFLATPAASYINGINLPVDGGRTHCL